MKTPFNGAQTTLYCCLSSLLEDETGCYYEECRLSEAHRRALDEDAQKRLWDWSERAVAHHAS